MEEFIKVKGGILDDIRIVQTVDASEDKIVVHPSIMFKMLNNAIKEGEEIILDIKKGQ